MKVANFEAADGLSQGIGVVTEDGLLDFGRAYCAYQVVMGDYPEYYLSIQEMIEAGEFEPKVFRDVMKFVDEAGLVSKFLVDEGCRLLAPVMYPPSIYALGRNFPEHAIEHGGEIPSEPIIFMKASSSVIGPDEPVIYKRFLTRVDPEVELAVIIGRRGSNISITDALGFIAGYTIINDVTARDMQSDDISAAKPWFRSKSIDTFCPMGPYVLLPDAVKEPLELDLEMRVNGEIRQEDNTRNLIFNVPYMISWISKYMTLRPGDVISMGTPEGMTPVMPGEVMEAHIEGIGTLRNPVIAEE
ncbi:MAG: fumarylacetoacetate hydrolase family protein [Armatimonadota bacterium]